MARLWYFLSSHGRTNNTSGPMTNFRNKRCKPCEGGVPPLDDATAREYLAQLDSGWTRSADGTRIQRTFKFRNYYQTTAFVNAVVWIAHQEDHHPDIAFTYNKADISYSTHAVGGLTENDFICAAKVDALIPKDE